MQEKNLISVAKYAAKHKISIYNVIKKINQKELESVKVDDKDFIVEKKSENKQKKSLMRRDEFCIQDEALTQEIFKEVSYGTLSLVQGSIPYCVPLNFAIYKNDIIFHGAVEGKKMQLIRKNPQACFNVVKEYSFIPSYFTSDTSACAATQFFASVFCEGEISLITDLEEKTKALTALMQKIQPEKKYENIETSNPIYTKMLEKTAIMKLKIHSCTTKIKAGQNLNKDAKEKLIAKLNERGSEVDLKTVELIKKL
jgi:nitroimidazol reductase NimA-like FMN-containing flavoprotein (pyridoxamine 5'-phosphate oxidase superfamily)